MIVNFEISFLSSYHRFVLRLALYAGLVKLMMQDGISSYLERILARK